MNKLDPNSELFQWQGTYRVLLCSLEVILGFIMTLFFARDEGALLTMAARSSLWGFSGYLFCDLPQERVGNSDIKKTDRTLLEEMGTKNSDFNARIMVGLDGE